MSTTTPSKLKLLMVEDNPGDARLLRELLSEMGGYKFEVAWVEHLAAAKAWLGVETADAVLLDLGLRDARGLEAVRAVGTAQPEVPIVVLTGSHFDDEEMGVRAVRAGAQDYLTKGAVDAPLLLRVVRHAIERKQAEVALRHSERRYRDLIQSSRGLVSEHDLEGRLLSVNRAYAEALGYAQEELVGRLLADFVAPGVKHLIPPYLEELRAEGAAAGLLQVVTRGGERRFWIFRNSVYQEAGRPPYVIGHAQDITEQKERELQFHEESQRDPLTGCHNRRFLERFEANAVAGESWGCVVIDVDHFKRYNDVYGHQAGDAVLVGMGRFLGRVVRLKEEVVRLGGDEFAVLLPGAGKEATEAVATRLREEGPQHAPVSFSLGWAAREGDETVASTLDRADRSLLAVRVAERAVDSRWAPEDSGARMSSAALAGAPAGAELAPAYDATIEDWARALDMREKRVEGNSPRVADLTLDLARTLGVSEQELPHVRRGALLHDIGKMGVPDRILLKPGALTEEEWAVMRAHPGLAFEMLSPIRYLRPALDIPYCHHEKWDGTGYPRGLRGDQIPLVARIFAVVDVWASLTAERPYRPAWPEEKVRDHIRSLAGIHFDPRVVDAFVTDEVPEPGKITAGSRGADGSN